MNRPITVIIMLLFVWANAALGVSSGCCCPTDTRELIECADDSCRAAHHDSSCKHKNAANHKCHDGCVSFRCPQDLSPARLTETESVLPQYQALALPVATIDARESLKTAWANTRPFLSHLEKPLSLLLQTCSFLS
ncbi:MAG: hypothetical protein HY913_19495 [Desulfomonile tiedjei]|nr:hypothetical protein [Desulfomonile tiedjei]